MCNEHLVSFTENVAAFSTEDYGPPGSNPKHNPHPPPPNFPSGVLCYLFLSFFFCFLFFFPFLLLLFISPLDTCFIVEKTHKLNLGYESKICKNMCNKHLVFLIHRECSSFLNRGLRSSRAQPKA